MTISSGDGLSVTLDIPASTTGDVTTDTNEHDFSGGSDGDVWTRQADGSVAFEAPSAATVTVDQYDVVARLAAGTGSATGIAVSVLTEETAPAAGDFLLGWESGGAMRKFDVGDLPYVAGALGSTDNVLLRASGTGGSTAQGSAALLSDNADLTLYDATNNGNPEIRLGGADAEELHIQTVFDSGAQTLDYVLFQTDAASATADKGLFRFNVDGTDILDIDDGGLEITGSITVSGTVDGRDIASDGGKLDNIEANADVTDAGNVDSAGAVMESDYNANTILAATSDDTPAALTVGEQTLVGRVTSGNIAALSASAVRTLLNVEDGATADQTDEEIQDIVGAMLTGNTETLVTVTYQDGDGTIDFVVDNDLANYSNTNSDFATVTGSETLTNKTLTSPVINVGSDAEGDIYYRNSGGAFTRLAAGSDGNVLALASGVPSWTSTGGGDVSKAGTPADNQIGVWTGDGTIEGTSDFTFDGADLLFYNAANDGNPEIRLGAADAEEFHLQTVFDSGAQTLDYVLFQTDAASATADKGLFRFNVDGAAILDVDDGGINFAANKGVSINGADILTDSGGTATLSNIDAIDSTTESTLEAALDLDALQGNLNLASQVTGTLTHENGGLEADVSSYTGILAVAGGSTVEVDTLNELNTQIGDATIVSTDSSVTLTNKTIDGDNNTLSNLDLGNEVDWAAAADVDDASAFESGDKLLVFEIGVGLRKIDYDDLPAGTGTIDGGTGSTDNALLRANGTGGSTAQGSTAVLSDTGDLTIYDATNDGNPVFALGAAAAERLTITPTYDSGAQTLDYVEYATAAASATADKGLHRFNVDGTAILDIDDGGVNFAANKGISINGADILTDSSGTATLSNIDALDATTEATIEAAIDTLANLTAASSLATVGTIGTGVWEATDVAVAHGGTGASDASGARTNLGLVIGTNVQAQGDVLDDLNSLGAALSDGEIIVATGAGAFAYESGATLRTSIGVGTGDSPQFTGIELGDASDTTLTRSSAGVVAVEGVDLATIDDVEVSDINAQTDTAHTLVIGDRGQTVTMDNASANTLTIPTNASVAFDTGTVIHVLQIGAGTTTITGDTGVTVNGVSAGSGDINNQYQGVSLLKVATNTWIASGDIGTVS